MIIKNIKKNKGFVILFAVMLSSILLAIALGVSNIAFREVTFGSSAKNANDAFFAADVGAECALFNDKNLTVLDPFPSQITCGNNPSIPVDINGTFILSGLGSSNRSCAIVTVTKDLILSITTVISKGYNNGDVNCIHSSNSLERELEVTY
jgi:hypothetical protein